MVMVVLLIFAGVCALIELACREDLRACREIENGEGYRAEMGWKEPRQ